MNNKELKWNIIFSEIHQEMGNMFADTTNLALIWIVINLGTSLEKSGKTHTVNIFLFRDGK